MPTASTNRLYSTDSPHNALFFSMEWKKNIGRIVIVTQFCWVTYLDGENVAIVRDGSAQVWVQNPIAADFIRYARDNPSGSPDGRGIHDTSIDTITVASSATAIGSLER